MPTGSPAGAAPRIEQLVGADGAAVDPDQLAAATAGVDHDLVVISGGPGTGSRPAPSRFLAGLVAAEHDAGAEGGSGSAPQPLRIALAAPTGKAAARMTEAVRGAVRTLAAYTSTSRWSPSSTSSRRSRSTASWAARTAPGSATVRASRSPTTSSSSTRCRWSRCRSWRICSPRSAPTPRSCSSVTPTNSPASRPERCSATSSPVRPATSRRACGRCAPCTDRTRGPASSTSQTRSARATRTPCSPCCTATATTCAGSSSTSTASHPGSVRSRSCSPEAATAVVNAATAGDVDTALQHLGATKVLCAHRRGDLGVEGWNRRLERQLGVGTGGGTAGGGAWYPGRPVMVTRNDDLNGVVNGDVGVATTDGEHTVVWFPRAGGPHRGDSARLDRIATQWAMSIHKSQESSSTTSSTTLPSPRRASSPASCSTPLSRGPAPSSPSWPARQRSAPPSSDPSPVPAGSRPASAPEPHDHRGSSSGIGSTGHPSPGGAPRRGARGGVRRGPGPLTIGARRRRAISPGARRPARPAGSRPRRAARRRRRPRVG